MGKKIGKAIVGAVTVATVSSTLNTVTKAESLDNQKTDSKPLAEQSISKNETNEKETKLPSDVKNDSAIPDSELTKEDNKTSESDISKQRIKEPKVKPKTNIQKPNNLNAVNTPHRKIQSSKEDLEISTGEISILSGAEKFIDKGKPSGTIEPGKDYDLTDNVTKFTSFSYEVPFTLNSKSGLSNLTDYKVESIEIQSYSVNIIRPDGSVDDKVHFNVTGTSKFTNNLSAGTTGKLGITFKASNPNILYSSTVSPVATIKVKCNDGEIYKKINLPTMHLTPNKTIHVEDNRSVFNIDTKLSQLNGQWGVYGYYDTIIYNEAKDRSELIASNMLPTPIVLDSTVDIKLNSKSGSFKIVSVTSSSSSKEILNKYTYDEKTKKLSLTLNDQCSYRVKFFIPVDSSFVESGGQITMSTKMEGNALSYGKSELQKGVILQNTGGSHSTECSVPPMGEFSVNEYIGAGILNGTGYINAMLNTSGYLDVKAGSYQIVGVSTDDYALNDFYEVERYHVDNVQDVMNGGQTLTDILTGKIKPLDYSNTQTANIEIRKIDKDTSNVRYDYYLTPNLRAKNLYKTQSKAQICSLIYLPNVSVKDAQRLYGKYLSAVDSIQEIGGKTYIRLGSNNPNKTKLDTVIRFNQESITDVTIPKFGVQENITSFITDNRGKYASGALSEIYDYTKTFNLGFNLTCGGTQEYLIRKGAKITLNVPTDFKLIDNKIFESRWDTNHPPVKVTQDGNKLIFEFLDNYTVSSGDAYGSNFALLAPVQLYETTSMRPVAPTIENITGVKFNCPSLGNPDITNTKFCKLNKFSEITHLMPVKVATPVYNVSTNKSDTMIQPEYVIRVNNGSKSPEDIVALVGAPNSEYSLSVAKNNPNHIDTDNGNGHITSIDTEGSTVYYLTSDKATQQDKDMIHSKNLDNLRKYYDETVTRKWNKYTGQELPNNVIALALFKKNVEPGFALHSSFKTDLGVEQFYTKDIETNSMFNYIASVSNKGSESNLVKTVITKKPCVLHVKYLDIFGEELQSNDIKGSVGDIIENPNRNPREGYSFSTMTLDGKPVPEFPREMMKGEHTLILTETKIRGKSKETVNFIDTSGKVLKNKFTKVGLEDDSVNLQRPPIIEGYRLVNIVDNSTHRTIQELPKTLLNTPSEYTCVYAKENENVTTIVTTESGKELYRETETQKIGEKIHPKNNCLDNIDWNFYDKNNIKTYINNVLVDTITQPVREGNNEIKLVVKPHIGVMNIKIVTDTGKILSKATTVKGELGTKVDSKSNYDNSLYDLVNIKVNGNIVNEEPRTITAGTTDVVYTVSKKPATVLIQLVNKTTGDTTNVQTIKGKLQDKLKVDEPLFDTTKYELINITQDGNIINTLPSSYNKQTSTLTWNIKEKSKSTIITNVIDENGNKLFSDSVTNYKDFKYDHKSPIIDLSVYDIVSSPDNIPKQFTNNNIVLNYKVAKRKTNINVKVVNSNGEEILKGNSYSGKVGDNVNIIQPNIPHEYSLVNITNNGKIVTSVPVSFSKDNQEIIYHVKKKNKSSVTISVIEKGTNDVLLKPVMYEGYVGEQIKTDKINIPDDYELVSTTVNGKSMPILPSIYDKTDTTIVYTVQKKQVNLVIKVICDDKELSSKTYTGKPDEITNAQLPNIPHDYNLVKVTTKGTNNTNIPRNFGAHDIEINYHVQKRSKGNIYTKVVTTDGKQIGNTITSTGYVGDRFILKEPNWDNNKYYMVSVSNIPSAYANEDTTILYTIAPRPSAITIRVRTVDGDVIYSKSYTGVVGDNFKYDKPVIPESYDLIKTPTMPTQFNKTNETFDYVVKSKDTGTYNVIIKTDDNVVLYESSSTKNVGASYTYPSTKVDMSKYDIVSKPNLTPSTYVKGNHDLVTIVKPHTSTITIKVMNDNKELVSKSYTGQTGDDFKFEEPNIDSSYELVMKPDYVPEKFSRDNETLLYKVKPKQNKIKPDVSINIPKDMNIFTKPTVKPKEQRKSTITVITKDLQGNIIDSKTYTDTVGSDFKFTQPITPNGMVVYTNDIIPAKFDANNKTIIYHQSKIGRSVVNINAVDRMGEDLMNTKTYNGNIGSKIPYGKLVFDENKYRIDYVTVNGSKVNNVPMYFTNETQNVTYHLRETTSNISSKIVLDDNTLIKDLGTQTGVYGSQYHTLKPEIPSGYTLMSRYVNGVQNAELPNKYGKDNIEIVYVVKRDSNSNVLPKQDIVKQLTDRNINTQLSELDNEPSTALVLANTGTLETQSSGIISSVLTAISALLVHLKLRRKNDNN